MKSYRVVLLKGDGIGPEIVEEAIKVLTDLRPGCGPKSLYTTAEKCAVLDLALAALRSPTREMVERMRGEWVSTGAISCRCSYCGHTELKTRATEYSWPSLMLGNIASLM